MVTSGPGTTNLITGIANAQMDSIPILIITGQVTTNFIGTEIFGITLPIIKHSYKIIDPKEILKLQGYRFQYKVNRESILNAVQLIRKAERPILYVGGGSIIENAYQEIFDLAKFFSIPVTTTLMGKGVFDERKILSLRMLEMHGTAYANFTLSECNLLIAIGARFDDKVTGKLDFFACLTKIIQIDIDLAEIGKNIKFLLNA